VIDGHSVILTLRSEVWKQVQYSAFGSGFTESTAVSKEFLQTIISILKYAKVEIYGINKFK